MAPQDKPAPLPLAPDRAALSNRISMLLSNRTSLLKSLTSGSSSSPTTITTTTITTRPRPNLDDDDELWKGTRPNEGVGYLPDSKTASKDISKEERMLRGRLLGKRRNATSASRKVESESDEEEGRSGLGKRKRPRRQKQQEGEIKPGDEEPSPGNAVLGGNKAETRKEELLKQKTKEDVAMTDEATANGNIVDKHEDPELNKNQKKKKRKKKSKTKVGVGAP